MMSGPLHLQGVFTYTRSKQYQAIQLSSMEGEDWNTPTTNWGAIYSSWFLREEN